MACRRAPGRGASWVRCQRTAPVPERTERATLSARGRPRARERACPIAGIVDLRSGRPMSASVLRRSRGSRAASSTCRQAGLRPSARPSSNRTGSPAPRAADPRRGDAHTPGSCSRYPLITPARRRTPSLAGRLHVGMPFLGGACHRHARDSRRPAAGVAGQCARVELPPADAASWLA